MDSVEVSASHRPLHVLLKEPPICLQLVGCLLVQWVLGIRLQEEVLQAVDDAVDGQHGFPVLAENVKAHVALEVDVRVVDALRAFHFRRLVRVVGPDLEVEGEAAAAVETFVGANHESAIRIASLGTT